MIRYIVENFASESDYYGNRYHFARVTSTKTGHLLYIDDPGGDSGASITVKRLLDLDGASVYSIQQSIPKREWKRLHEIATSGKYYATYYVDDLTAADLRRLNRKRDLYGEKQWQERNAS